jgi:hypothetical protein
MPQVLLDSSQVATRSAQKLDVVGAGATIAALISNNLYQRTLLGSKDGSDRRRPSERS